MPHIRVRRLQRHERTQARRLFLAMAEVFGEPHTVLDDAYLDRLLASDAFWALAAFEDKTIVGGLTAHALPMTRVAASELFIYDLAVRADRQRQGIGRQLMEALRQQAARAGVLEIIVPADNADGHALDFYRAIGGTMSAVTYFSFSPAAV